MPKNKIIYLVGLDRSGSTITGALLGMQESIAHFGELQFHAKAVLENRIVSGDQRIGEMPYWQSIHALLTKELGADVFEQQIKLKDKYERWRNLPLLLFHFITKNQQLAAYWKYNRLLIDALLEQENKTWICDSSKNMISRLGLSGDFDLKTILLIRDARAYCWSKQKRAEADQEKYNLKRTSLKWLLNNTLFVFISFWASFLKIRFEELGDHPDLALEKIGTKIGLDFSQVKKIIIHKYPIKLGNIIAGSHSVRKLLESDFRSDVSWETKLTNKDKRVILLLTGWLMKLVGYRVNE
jgi:hypothetical protein